jgi:hypothetical protein
VRHIYGKAFAVANLEKAVNEILDIVNHLVGTHVHWNVDLSKDAAVAKIEVARLALLATDVENVLEDVADGDLGKTIADLEKALADAKALAHPEVPVNE